MVIALRADGARSLSVFAPIFSNLSRPQEGATVESATELLADLKAGQEEIKAGQERLQNALAGHGDLLRMIAERLGLVLEKLYPAETEGPTLQELLAEMVGRLGDNTVLLTRIDRRTETMASSLPDDIVRVLKDGPGANGDGHAGTAGANGHGRPS